MTKTLQERFDEKYTPEPNTGCWLWTASVFASAGYGSIGIKGKLRGAHRVSYELHIGPIPAGTQVCHRCDQRSCVNPAHLFLGQHAHNMLDKAQKGRARHGRAHHNTKIQDEELPQIFALRSLGWTWLDIAKLFGVHKSTVRRIGLGGRFAASQSPAHRQAIHRPHYQSVTL